VAIFSHISEVQTISGMMKAAVEDTKSRGWTVEPFDGRRAGAGMVMNH